MDSFEVEALIKAKSGDNESFEILLKKYEKYIYMNTKDYYLIDGEREDLIQEGMIGLLKDGDEILMSEACSHHAQADDIGKVLVGDGGTGATTASAAASALGVGAEDSPSFVTMNANVNAGNVTSASIKLTDPAIVGTFNTQTITINAKNRTYGTAPLVVINGDLESLYFTNLINGAQIVVPILATGADRAVSKDLTNVNFTVITDDVSITQDKHSLMTLSNISGNIYMNTVAFS